MAYKIKINEHEVVCTTPKEVFALVGHGIVLKPLSKEHSQIEKGEEDEHIIL